MQRKTTDFINKSNSGRTISPQKSGNLEGAATTSKTPVSIPVPEKPNTKPSTAPITPPASRLSVVPDLLPETCPFQELLDEWLDACRADGLSPKTREDYVEKAGKFRWWWVEYSKKPPHPENVTTKDVRAYAAYLREPLAFRWGHPVPPNKETLAPASIHSYGRVKRQ
jgi:hypothetical protein